MSVLTHAELEACKRVLGALRAPACATLTLTWSDADLRAYVSLSRAGYIETVPTRIPRKASAPFRWDRICATAAGLRWLEQCRAPRAYAEFRQGMKPVLFGGVFMRRAGATPTVP